MMDKTDFTAPDNGAPMVSGRHHCLQMPQGIEIHTLGASRAALRLAGTPPGMNVEVQMATRILFCPFCGDRIGEWDNEGPVTGDIPVEG